MQPNQIIDALLDAAHTIVRYQLHTRGRLLKQRLSRDLLAPDDAYEASGHLFAMCDQALVFVHQNRLGKAQRWLGFIQGALWHMRLVTINHARRANMPPSSSGEEFRP